MEYFTILWIIALGGDIDGSTSAIVYRSLAECQAATSVVSATIGYDHQMECEVTGTLSASVRPERNPRYE